MSLKTKAISGLKWTGSSAAGTTALRFAQVTVLARFLSPVDFGLMAMALITIDIVMVNIDLGVSAGIIYNQATTKDELSSLYWMNIFTGIVVFVIVFLSRSVISRFFREPMLYDLLLWISASFLIIPMGSQFRVLMQKDLKFGSLAKLEIFSKFCEAFVAIAMAAQGYGVWSLVSGYLFGVCVHTVILVSYGLKHYRPSMHFKFNDLKFYLSFGLYQMATRTIGIFSDKLDQIIIGGLFGTQNLGYYSFAHNIASQPISRLAPVLMKVFFPVFSKVQNDVKTLRRGYLKVVKMLMSMIAPLALGLVVVAPNWIVPIFGEKWVDSIMLVQILALVALVRGPGRTFSSLVLAKGKANLMFIWAIFIFFYRLIILFAGGKLFGISGLAICLLGAQIGLLIPSYFYFVRPFIGSCGKLYMASIIKPILLAGMMAIGVFVITYFDQASILYLLRDICVGGLLYLSLLYLFDRGVLYEIRQAIVH